MGITKIIEQLFVSERLLNRVQISALNILNNRELKRFLLSRLDHNDRDFVQPGALCGSPPAFPRYELEGVTIDRVLAHNDRLNDSALLDRLDKIGEIALNECATWISWVRLYQFNRNAFQALLSSSGRCHVSKQAGQSATKPRAILF